MGDVVSLGKAPETLEAFLRRNGPSTTQAVAQRFGWRPRVALAKLRELEMTGKAVSSLEHALDGAVRIYVWRVI